MTAVLVAAIILAVLTLAAVTRVGVTAEYCDEGFEVTAYAGPVRYRLYSDREPAGNKEKRRKEKTEKKADQENPAAEGVKKAGKLESLKNKWPLIRETLSRLKRKLLINDLTVYYKAAGTDPAAAALSFGAASAGYGVVVPLLESNFNVRHHDFRAAVDFQATEPYIYLKAKLSLRVWEALYVGYGLGKAMLTSGETRKKLKGGLKNG